MGKRIEVKPYRSSKPRYVVKAGARLVQTAPSSETVMGDAAFILAHKRKLNADRQKRYRLAVKARKGGNV